MVEEQGGEESASATVCPLDSNQGAIEALDPEP